MKEIRTNKVYGYFEQGSTILVITHDGKRANLMPASYHMMLDESGIIAIGIGAWAYSYKTLLKTKECVLAIPTVSLLETTVKAGNCSGKDTDKFQEFGLTALPSKTVKPPLLSEAFINAECTFIDDDITKRYNILILNIQKAWRNEEMTDKRLFHHNGNGIFTIDGEKKDLGDLMILWSGHVANRD
ncbi:MAG: flavin reductase family protein [Methanimicrococcus sp.]|nr:flavin reductase family protein [Methanimicrococcus sp.]